MYHASQFSKDANIPTFESYMEQIRANTAASQADNEAEYKEIMKRAEQIKMKHQKR